MGSLSIKIKNHFGHVMQHFERSKQFGSSPLTTLFTMHKNLTVATSAAAIDFFFDPLENTSIKFILREQRDPRSDKSCCNFGFHQLFPVFSYPWGMELEGFHIPSTLLFRQRQRRVNVFLLTIKASKKT
jgi:hypothetical protein